MSVSSMLEKLKTAVLEGDDDLAQELAKKALKERIEPLKIVNEGILPGIQDAGELWKQNIYFHTDIILCAEAFRLAMEVIEPNLSAGALAKSGKVIIGTVAGDMHNLGKIMVNATLRGGGFEVIDLGEDVSQDTFIQKVKELNPNILGLGCYMSTTMLEMKDIINKLNDEGLRNKLKVMIGGVPCTQEYADEIGADAWGKDAFDSVEKAKKLMGV
ncbi:MAG: corrinoid protein [Candidatus Lokiarchaeota archaeon]|nr:corrinoid protein [Candidatus Lokiarchaeota archaeon]